MTDYVEASIGLRKPLRRLALALIVTLVLLLTACSATRNLSSSQITKQQDTVIRTEIIRDTVVVVEGDESMIRALLECDSTGQVRMKELMEYRAGNRLHPPSLQIRDNILTATAACDSIAIYLQLKDRYERHISAERQTEVQTIEVNRLNGWQRMWMRTGQALTIVLLIFGAFKIRKLLKA